VTGADPPADGFSTRLLLALFAPGSVEAAVCALQDSLFSRHGMVSAIALAPLIPILFLPASAGPRVIEGLGRGLLSCRFSVTGMRWEGEGLWLGVESSGTWGALKGQAGELFPAAEAFRPLFSPAEGFCLGCWEAPQELRPLLPAEAPPLRFSSCTLALASLTVREGEREWWREVYLETLAEKPLRAMRPRSRPA
jgi:hypothetical protein